MIMKVVKNKDIAWKIVFVHTVENTEPVYYRVVNLNNYDTEDIPAYRILDEVVNGIKNIINLRCKNNNIYIIDDQGYESLNDVIAVDEFDKEPITLLEWGLRNGEIGSTMLNRFDGNKNDFSPSNYRIKDNTKVAWTCKNGHTIRCGIATYFSTKCKCPICEMEEVGETPSLRLWAQLTGNYDILKAYELADNELDSSEIKWRSTKEVKFKQDDLEIVLKLNKVTSSEMILPFNKAINLSKGQ